jgi:hypothetical protein
MCVSSVDSLGPANGASGWEDHSKDDHDAEQDEGARPEGEIFKVVTRQCIGMCIIVI